MSDEDRKFELSKIMGVAVAGGAATLDLKSAIAAGTGEAVRQAVQMYRSPTDIWLDEAMRIEREELKPELDAAGATLLEEDKDARPAEVAAAMAAGVHAWEKARRRCANGQQARLIRAALLHGFDPEAYREGMALIVLDVLEGLDYPDIRALKNFAKLASSGSPRKNLNAASLDWFHAERLKSRGLVVLNGMKVSQVTELGMKVLKYVESELSELGQDG